MYLFSKESARSIIDNHPYPSKPELNGKGIVIAAGGRYFVNAFANIKLLRHLGCHLPIMVYHLPHETDETFNNAVKDYGVTVINALTIQQDHPHDHLGGWELKSYAILWSGFKDVLFLDADCFPVRNPDYLFDTPEYQQTGCILFPDVGNMEKTRPWWDVYGVPYRDEPEIESGAIYIDKERHWTRVAKVDFINQYGIRWFWDNAKQWGDKDTWRAVWHMDETPYTMPTKRLQALEGTMVQHDLAGARLFQHRNNAKFNVMSNKKIAGFQHEDLLLQFVDEYRRLKLDIHPENCVYLHNKKFIYIRLGHDQRDMFLLPNSNIGLGAGGREKFYYVAEGRLHILGDDGEVTAILHRCENEPKVWIGRWLNHERMIVMMVEQDD